MTNEQRRTVSMTLFMWVVGGMCTGFGGLMVLAWQDNRSASVTVDQRLTREIEQDRVDIQRLEQEVATRIDERFAEISKKIDAEREFAATHRVRIWDRLQSQERVLQDQNGNIKALEAGQNYIARQVDRLVERLVDSNQK